ncbi:hypothetical protein J5N97_003013 [Dioscorea zingiberensis]|uniref:Uncharacterized protein n=1 Tax=Dioscorea zingiberensis TaxID=325984 RepID=A0A9D5D5F0_9LILI|nr:hypothetical protein J5N97_003013 [Dioscorea zingiberensis]
MQSSTGRLLPNMKLEHVSFIRYIAAARPPEHLNCLLNVLQARGETIVSPGAREGLIPLVIPLSIRPSGALTSLLRWPTSPPGMEMPIVEVHKHGVWLLAKNVDQYIHRILVEEDADASKEHIDKLWDAASAAGKKLYTKGDFLESGITDLDVYLLKKVGLFPDVLERKVAHHFQKGDHEVAEIAQWEDEQIEYIKEKVSDDGKREDLKKGKEPEQVSLDEAAFLLDLASVEGTWTDNLDRIAECYKEAGLSDMARFILYKD